MPAITTPTKRIKAGDLDIDPRVQRDHRNEATLNKIRENFQAAALQTLQVSERKNGTYVVLDGWHRLTVVLELLGKDYVLPCQVHTGLNLEQEAALFLEFNNQKAANRLDLHGVRLIQKDPVATALEEAAKDNGWVIGLGQGKIMGVAALETVYYRGENFIDGFGQTLLYNTLMVITGAWGHDQPRAVDAAIIKAVGEFLFILERDWVDPQASKDIDFKRLVNALAKLTMGPKGWLDSCRGNAKGANERVITVMLRSLYDLYNQEDRAGKLPRLLRAD